MTTQIRATVEDLCRLPHTQKAELVNGEIVLMSPTGVIPGRASSEIYLSLRQYERRVGGGYAIPDNVGFVVDLPNRQSFSPDAAWCLTIPFASDLSFAEGAPRLAVEVRSEGDYGATAERAMEQKRDDYFKAGTLVVWDVDLRGEDIIRKYTADAPFTPTLFRRGHVADAEPAVPGWTMAVDDLFV